MMKVKQQKAYFKSLWNEMEAHLIAFYDTQDSEELHQMRVLVKKIRALLNQLTDVSEKKKTSSYMKKLREIFKHAGRLRSVHVNLEVMDELNVSNPDFLDRQQEILANETGLLYARHDEYMKSLKKAFKAFSKRFMDIKDKKIYKLFEKQVADLAAYFASSWEFDDHLHEARKHIKELLYLHQALNEDQTQLFTLNTEYLHQLQDLIGKWHDLVLTLQLVEEQFPDHGEMVDRIAEKISKLESAILSASSGFNEKVALTKKKVIKKKHDKKEAKEKDMESYLHASPNEGVDAEGGKRSKKDKKKEKDDLESPSANSQKDKKDKTDKKEKKEKKIKQKMELSFNSRVED